MLCWLVGPGLLVNTVLKDHVGRPRPVQLEQFRGHERYVPPFQIALQHVIKIVLLYLDMRQLVLCFVRCALYLQDIGEPGYWEACFSVV